MSSRWKKVWADVWGNKPRTLLTMMTIMVGTFAVGFNNNMNLYLFGSMESDYLSAQPSEALVYAFPLDDEKVEIARAVPGVDAVEGRSTSNAKLVWPGGKDISVQFTGVEDPNGLTLNQLKPVPGEIVMPLLGEKEILLDASAASLGYKPGDTIIVELESGKRREMVLAGYMHDVTSVPLRMSNMINAYVTPKTIEWLGGMRTYNALAISVAEKQTDQEHVTKIAQAVADRMERAGAEVYFVRVDQPGRHYAWDIAQGVYFVLLVLGYLTVLLSGFLIVNMITAIMTQQTRQIGIMKAVGGGNGQIFRMYVVLVLAFGLGALAFAIPLADHAAEIVGASMAQYLNFSPLSYKSYPGTMIQQAIVALVVPFLAALWPMHKSVRITVREAISDYGIGGNAKPKDKPVNRGALLIPRPMRLSLRNALRRKLRLGLTLFSLVLAGAIFIGVYNLWEAFDKSVEEIQGYILADINISFGRAYRFNEVAEIAQAVPGVASVEGWMEYPGTLVTDEDQAGKQIRFVAPPSTSTLIDPVIIAGRWLTTGDENAAVIGNQLLQVYPDLKVGDWLTVEIDGSETRWHIVGIYTITDNMSYPSVYVNYEYLSRLVGQPGQVYSLRVVTEKDDAMIQRRIANQLNALYEEKGIQAGSAQLGADYVLEQQAMTDVLVYFMLGMAALIAIVGGLGLMGTMSINVLERTREIGVIRAIGASSMDIQSIVIVEGIAIGLIAWIISIVLSIPITGVLTYGVGMAVFTTPMTPVFGLTGILAWLLFTLVLAAIASAVPARRASRLTVRDTLAYE